MASKQHLFVRVTVTHFGDFGERTERHTEVRTTDKSIEKVPNWTPRAAGDECITLAYRVIRHVNRELEGMDG